MLTLAQVKSSSVASIAGVNVNDPQFTLYVNDAVRMLMELGGGGVGGSRGWWGTVQAIDGVCYDGCFVWPSNIVTVLGIRTKNGPVELKNFWYSFIEPSEIYGEMAKSYNGRPAVEFDGQTCLYRSIANSPTQIQVLADNAADVGKVVTIYGTDENGAELSYTSNGVTQRGIPLTVGGQSSFTQSKIAFVEHVAKDITFGKIRLVAYSNGVGNETLAIYNGGDVNPKFLYSRILKACSPVQIKALVKLGFSGVAIDSDIIPLDNIDAIKSMVQSIRAAEAGNVQDAANFERMALRRLVAQVNSRFPLEQTSVQVKPFGMGDPNSMTSMI
jgi:hypothetical protein